MHVCKVPFHEGVWGALESRQLSKLLKMASDRWVVIFAFLPPQPPSKISFLVPKLLFFILAHPVYKMWIIQEQNKLELWKNCVLKRKKRKLLFFILAHPVYKLWIIQKQNKLELWKNCVLKRKKWKLLFFYSSTPCI